MSNEAVLTFGDKIIERPNGPTNAKSVDDILGEPCPYCGKTTRLFYDEGCRFELEDGRMFVNIFDGMTAFMDCLSCGKTSKAKFGFKVEVL